MEFIPDIVCVEITTDKGELTTEECLCEIDKLQAAYDQYMLLSDVLLLSEMVSSKGEAKRLIQQGGIKVNGEKIIDTECYIKIGEVYLLQRGKLIFKKIKLKLKDGCDENKSGVK